MKKNYEAKVTSVMSEPRTLSNTWCIHIFSEQENNDENLIWMYKLNLGYDLMQFSKTP